jgi:predicted dehydrogenase
LYGIDEELTTKMTKLSRIGVGLIGAGLMGYRHSMAINTIRGAYVSAVADIDTQRAKELAQKLGAEAVTSTDELLERTDVDAVIIAVPDDDHLAPTLKALEHRKHILLEKPLATTLEDGWHIVEAVESAPGWVFMVGHLLRFDPRFVGAAEAVASGRIGDVLHITLRRNSSLAGPRRYKDRARLHFHVSAHDADLLRFITSQEVERVYAQAVQRGIAGEDQYDSLLATINLSGGSLGQMEACWALPPTYRAALDGFVEVVGTKGVVYVDTLRQGLTLVDADGVEYPDTMRYWELGQSGLGLVHNQMEHFIECIDRQQQPKVGVMEGFEAIRICQALIDSITLDQPVSLGSGSM